MDVILREKTNTTDHSNELN